MHTFTEEQKVLMKYLEIKPEHYELWYSRFQESSFASMAPIKNVHPFTKYLKRYVAIKNFKEKIKQ